MPSTSHQTTAPHGAMLEDLADQMEVSAEVNAEPDVRPAWGALCQSPLVFARTKKASTSRSRPIIWSGAESGVDLVTLNRTMNGDAGRLQAAEWLARANPANSIDAVTGLLTRHESGRQLQARLNTTRLFSVFRVAANNSTSLVKQLSDNLVELVRPRDISSAAAVRISWR
jgi:hypothetical protein